MAVSNIPEWLTAVFIKSCLQSDEGIPQDIEITKYTAEPAVPAGNNYGSLMLRVKIEYKKLQINEKYSHSLIIKSPLTGGFIEKLGDSSKDVYEREPKYYNKFINETYKLCKHDIVPKHYKSPNPLCVVLEDLRSSGYMMVDRHKLLDLDHCRLYIKASSKLHALSVAVHKKSPEIIESLVLENTIFTEKGRIMIKRMVAAGFQCTIAYLENKPNYKEYMDIIKKLNENDLFWIIFLDMEKSKRSLKALIQSDPWCTNMMFKYDTSGIVQSVKLLDFQGLKFTTPITEFITFVWVSTNSEVRKENLHDLYHLYCDSLNDNLTELGCSERLSFEEMKAEMKSLSPMVLIVICAILPICIADSAVDINIFTTASSDLPIKETTMYKLYQGTHFSENYSKIIDQAAKEGVFDYLKEKISQIKL